MARDPEPADAGTGGAGGSKPRALGKLSHEELWGPLAGDKDRGLDDLARKTGWRRDDLLAALPALAVAQDPRRSFRRTLTVHALDVVVVLLLGALVALGWQAVGVWRAGSPEPEGDPTGLAALLDARAGEPWTAAELAGRSLVAMPADASALALAGDLPARVSVALVAADGGRGPRRFDDVALVAVEGGEHPWLVVALPPLEADGLLAGLGGARAVVLRPPQRANPGR